MAISRLKPDHDKDEKATQVAAKVDLMKDNWGRAAKSYQIGFQDEGKEDAYDRYFEGPEDYDMKANTTSILPLFWK